MDNREKDRFLIALADSDRTDHGQVPFEEQNEPQRVFSAIWDLESGVNNGGFHGYLSNSTGDSAALAPSALRQIGAANCAGIVERALRTASTELLPSDQGAREVLLEDLIDDFEDLDQEFYTYPDNLTELLYAFVARHPESFGPVQEG
jgi:hypothetical protein